MVSDVFVSVVTSVLGFPQWIPGYGYGHFRSADTTIVFTLSLGFGVGEPDGLLVGEGEPFGALEGVGPGPLGLRVEPRVALREGTGVARAVLSVVGCGWTMPGTTPVLGADCVSRRTLAMLPCACGTPRFALCTGSPAELGVALLVTGTTTTAVLDCLEGAGGAGVVDGLADGAGAGVLEPMVVVAVGAMLPGGAESDTTDEDGVAAPLFPD